MTNKIESRLVKNNIEKIKDLVPELKVIYTDVDGTLVGPRGCFFATNNGGFSVEPAEALIASLRKGIDIVLVSGRNMRQMLNDSRMLGVSNYISEMGSVIVHNLGEQIYYNFDEHGAEDPQVYAAIEKAGALQALFDAFPGMLEHHTPWSKEREFTAVLRGSIDVGKAREILAAFPLDLEIIDNGKIGRKSPTLKCDVSHAYHVMLKGTSKAAAVSKDMKIRDIPLNATIALGDSAADLEFAQAVGVFFMVGNGIMSHPELADKILSMENVFVTEDHMGLGWAEAVSLFL